MCFFKKLLLITVLCRYPNVACELLTSDVQVIVDQMTANDVSFNGVVVVKLLISNPFNFFLKIKTAEHLN